MESPWRTGDIGQHTIHPEWRPKAFASRLEMNVRRARAVSCADEEVHELDDGGLVGEIARVGVRRLPYVDIRTNGGIEVPHRLHHGLRGGVSPPDRLGQLLARDRDKFQGCVVRDFEVIEYLDRGFSRDGDA